MDSRGGGGGKGFWGEGDGWLTSDLNGGWG